MSDNHYTRNGINYTVAQEVIDTSTAHGLDILAEIEQAIDMEFPRAEIYSKPNCPFCVKAKALLEKNAISYTELSAVTEREALIERVERATGQTPKQVPQIFIDGQHIGGHDQLVEWLKGSGQDQ